MLVRLVGAACALALALGVAQAKVTPGKGHDKKAAMAGLASVYSAKSSGSSRTASGQRLQPAALTAAHRSLPFGTQVQVTNRRNGRTVVVRINDRGPFVRGRVIDLSPAAGHALGISGLAPVTLAVVTNKGT
ncbi:MAG TPA: septal ring lytic transglycosylase RlpA family protein [Pseudolabrys sp.]|nr:septal ring lytic transglycosylase RlpA family protein [Pseudolabrys sp.]